MAWHCARCDKNIFAPREDSFKLVVRWMYNRKYKDLAVDIVDLRKVPDNAVITHLLCKEPHIDGFADRIRKLLKMPVGSSHPMLV